MAVVKVRHKERYVPVHRSALQAVYKRGKVGFNRHTEISRPMSPDTRTSQVMQLSKLFPSCTSIPPQFASSE